MIQNHKTPANAHLADPLEASHNPMVAGSNPANVSAIDLELDGSYEPIGDVLYLSAPGDDKPLLIWR
jgi:hypothetical protein